MCRVHDAKAVLGTWASLGGSTSCAAAPMVVPIRQPTLGALSNEMATVPCGSLGQRTRTCAVHVHKEGMRLRVNGTGNDRHKVKIPVLRSGPASL